MYETEHWTDHAATPVFESRIDATGSGGNIFAVLGAASRMLREIDVPRDRIDALRDNVMSAANYDQAIAMIEYWFPVDRE